MKTEVSALVVGLETCCQVPTPQTGISIKGPSPIGIENRGSFKEIDPLFSEKSARQIMKLKGLE
jgi:hypothetical protein